MHLWLLVCNGPYASGGEVRTRPGALVRLTFVTGALQPPALPLPLLRANDASTLRCTSKGLPGT